MSTVTTDLDGSWNLTGLAAGDYTVEFGKTGFGLVRLVDIPSDSAGLHTVVPARSTAIVTEVVSADVDEDCGPLACLDLTMRVEPDGLFPEGAFRRIFRGFLGPSGELTRHQYDQTFWFLVTVDDPALTLGDGFARIELRGVRGLDLASAVGGNLAVLVLGATENTIFRSRDDDPPGAEYPDLAPVGAEGVVLTTFEKGPVRRPGASPSSGSDRSMDDRSP